MPILSHNVTSFLSEGIISKEPGKTAAELVPFEERYKGKAFQVVLLKMNTFFNNHSHQPLWLNRNQEIITSMLEIKEGAFAFSTENTWQVLLRQFLIPCISQTTESSRGWRI